MTGPKRNAKGYTTIDTVREYHSAQAAQAAEGHKAQDFFYGLPVKVEQCVGMVGPVEVRQHVAFRRVTSAAGFIIDFGVISLVGGMRPGGSTRGHVARLISGDVHTYWYWTPWKNRPWKPAKLCHSSSLPWGELWFEELNIGERRACELRYTAPT